MRRLVVLFGLLLVPLMSEEGRAAPEKTHTASHRTEHFVLLYRPGSRAGAAVERTGVLVERELAEICEALGLENDGRYRVFLYDDVAELLSITRTQGNAGFSAGDAMHIPFDNDQTRFHELVHLVAVRMPKTGGQPRNMFFVEGLANALLEFVHGVPVHAVAKLARTKRELPRLAEMTAQADFYAWMRTKPGFNAYDVAASYVRFLLATYGAESVRRYYTGTRPEDAFGKTELVLEKGWHAHLDAYVLRPEVETLLRKRAGEAVSFDRYPLDPETRLPKEVRGTAKQWKDVTRSRLSEERWSRTGGRIEGSGATQAWTWCDLGKKTYKSCVVQAVIRPAPGTLGVALRIGDGCRVLVVQAGTFLYEGDSQRFGTNQERLGAVPLHLVLVRRKDQVSVYVDGFLVLEGRLSREDGSIGLGVALGKASFSNIKVRKIT